MTPTGVAKYAFATVFIATVSAVFAISFSAIVYKGELAPFLDRGIGLTLMGSAVVAIVGSFTLSYRGSIVQPQDAPAILLAGGGASLVAIQGLSGEILFATVACMISVASLVTGLVALLVGKLRLALLARYIPYPVLAGFLATTGLLLLMGGIGVAIGTSSDAGSTFVFFEREALLKWVPVCVAAIVVVAATRTFPGPLTLPLTLLATTGGFYLIIAALGLPADEARNSGFLLGPFNSGSFLAAVSPQIVMQADWIAILSQVPLIVTVVAISLIGTTLNASGLELEVGCELDINQDVHGVGLANTLSAFVGGLPGYHLLGETILAQRLGLTGLVAGVSSATGCVVVLLLGGAVLSVMPTGLFATVIAFLGVDLLYNWLWKERRNLMSYDYAIVVLIPVIAITFSFLMAIAAGLLLAFCLFVIAYAKLDVIRSQTSLAVRRSYIERPDNQLNVLATAGKSVQIIELSGYLFFASASVLRERVQDILNDEGDKIDWLVIDFRHVSGVDISTWHMMKRLTSECDQRGIRVVFSGNGRLIGLENVGQEQRLKADRFGTMDQALEYIEDVLLGEYSKDGAASQNDVLTEITAMLPPDTFGEVVDTISATTGDVIIKRGSKSGDIYILQRGQLSVSIAKEDGTASVVAQIRPGSVIGEMAYYTGRERTADVIANGDVQLLRIDMRRVADLESKFPEIVLRFHKKIARHMARRLSRTTLLLRDLGL